MGHVMHSNILYSVNSEEQSAEKRWMRNLRRKRFQIVVAKQRNQRLSRRKKDAELRRAELEQQIEIKERMDELNALRAREQRLERDKLDFIQSAANELHVLKTVAMRLQLSS